LTDWKGLVADALRDLGGDSVPVPGAKLHGRVTQLGWERAHEDFSAHLRIENVKFAAFLDSIKNELGIRVDRHQAGADMLVGFLSAAPAPPARARETTRPPILRKDVFLALTTISPRPFFYDRERDIFTDEPVEGASLVALPSSNLADAIGERTAFAESRQDTLQREMLISSLRTMTPLQSFQQRVSELGLSRDWHHQRFGSLERKLKEWAAPNGLQELEQWFGAAPGPADDSGNPRRVLGELARHMTDQEIRSLSVPFRAVEEMHRSMSRGVEP